MPATNPNQTVSGQSQPVDPRDVEMFARQLSADSIRSTTAAGSGHPTSCLSAAHIVATILLRHIRLRPEVPDDPANDRLLFSKGHAAPLLYAALAAVDALDRDMLTDLRDSGSPLEGHPVPGLPHVPIATGSLGQGLANGLGMALATRHLGSPAQIFVLLGDSEMAEGSVWEAMALASHYRTSNLTAIVDVNRLGQRGPTMYGWDTDVYVHRAQAFGWSTGVVDGHDPEEISRGLDEISKGEGPGMLVARTVKGHGVSFLEDQPGKHGKALSKEDAEKAIAELHPGEWRTITVQRPSQQSAGIEPAKPFDLPEFQEETATRDAFGSALATIGAADPGVVILDAEVSDSTRTAAAKESVPGQFFQLYIAEQAMIGVAVGMQAVGLRPVASTFAAFMTRAHDFIRMGAISRACMVLNGSHAGVSIGEDGPSQMGLDDIAMMRATPGTAVLYPADGAATASLLEAALEWPGISYIRTTREKTPQIYESSRAFSIGGSHVLRSSGGDQATIVAAGVTVHEALAAAAQLGEEDIRVRVIDAYSVQPLDTSTVNQAMTDTGLVVVAEDHSYFGGLGDAVSSAVSGRAAGPVIRLGVEHVAGSATPQEQRELAGISSAAIKASILENLSGSHQNGRKDV